MTDSKIFKGDWICAHEFLNKQPLSLFHRDGHELCGYAHDDALYNIHMLVRKKLYIKNPNEYKRVKIKISADDYYKLYINGQFAAQGPAPGYHFAYYYNEFDISRFLTAGENTIYSDVYYQGLINRVWNSGDYRQGMIADITADGRLIASTGADWEYTLDPRYTGRRTTGYDTQFLEDFDSRKTPSGWRSAAVKPADYTFYPCPVKTLAVYKKYPVFCKRLVNGGWFYDFGEELTGSLHIVAQGKSGQTLRILCSEECTPDGRAMYNMRCNCKYEEFWTLSGKTDRLEQYDYKAFRYAEILSDDNLPFEIISVSAAARHYPFPENSCVLSCSDRTLCSVFNICKAGVKLGSQEVFVDCPSREKGQYSGDIAIAGAAHLLLTGDGSLFKKAIENQAQSLKIAPGMLAVSPGSFMQEIADYSLQFPLSVWRYYRYTGDINFLKAMALPCRKTVEYFKQFSRSDGLLEQVNEKWNMVDWPENTRDDYDFSLTNPVKGGCHNVLNAFYIGCIETTERIFKQAGLPVKNESNALKEAFNRCFFREDKGIYVDSEHSGHSSLHSNCLPVFFGINPRESNDSIARLLIKKGMRCSVYMSFFFLKALSALGKHEHVYRLITSKSKNSWYNMISEGATACFEAWGKEQKWNTSLCHPWASAPVTLLIEDLIGLKVNRGEVTSVVPKLPKDLKNLEITVPLKSEDFHFKYSSGEFSYKITRRASD